MKIGKQTIKLENTPKILNTSSMSVQKRCKVHFHHILNFTLMIYFSEKKVLKKQKVNNENMCRHLIAKKWIIKRRYRLHICWRSLNQCISSAYCIRDLNIPFFGLYGACSTFCEGLMLASLFVNAGYAQKVIATTSSHFCSAERQFRMPLEHGNQLSPTAQCTVTASGSALIVPKM